MTKMLSLLAEKVRTFAFHFLFCWMPEYELHTLPNGIRILHKQVLHTKIAHSGFTLDIGSRDENDDQLGLAHFWEHMAFKGTEKRK